MITVFDLTCADVYMVYLMRGTGARKQKCGCRAAGLLQRWQHLLPQLCFAGAAAHFMRIPQELKSLRSCALIQVIPETVWWPSPLPICCHCHSTQIGHNKPSTGTVLEFLGSKPAYPGLRALLFLSQSDCSFCYLFLPPLLIH